MVFYSIDSKIENFFYGKKHPMKPIRIEMVHDLIFSYGLHKFLNYRYPKKKKNYLLNFHTPVIINKLGCEKFFYKMKTYKYIKDCPVFLGVIEYLELYSAASVYAGIDIIKNKTNISVNWAGGLHHAKKSKNSGFCYVNDVVLLLLELLKFFFKIIYIDIDNHHGDGVEEAFYLSDRVFFLSFHNYNKNYFPKTGHHSDHGFGKGSYYSINIPLKSGIDDDSFLSLFKPIVEKIFEFFKPDTVVFQCGADSLFGDKLGTFNLSIYTYSKCINFVKTFHIPMVVLGGGGYVKKNVTECWTLETSILLNKKISLNLPHNSYWDFFYLNKQKINLIKKRYNMNSKKSLNAIKQKILCNIAKIKYEKS